MRKIVLAIILMVAALQSAKAQKDTLLYYLKNSGDIVAKEKADYVMLILPQEVNSDNKLFPILQYYTNGSRKLISATRSRTKLAYEGATMSFFQNGKRKSSIIYKNGNPTGIVTEYYPNGKIYTIINYEHQQPRIIECRDSTGIVLAKEGNGKWLKLSEDYETVISKETIKDGIVQDPWTHLLSRGKVGMASISITDITSNSESLKVDTLATFNNDANGFSKFLTHTIRYPAIDREKDITGKLIIGFTVAEDGQLTNFKILKNLSKTIDAEALRVLELTSPWVPAKASGKPVSVDFKVSLDFSLSEQ